MGDFNLPVTRWGNPLRLHTAHDLYTNLLESELHQHQHQELMRNYNTLDLIFSISENLVSNVNVGPVFSSSDYRIITLNLKMKEMKVKVGKEKVPNYQRVNFIRLQTILEDIDGVNCCPSQQLINHGRPLLQNLMKL